MSDISSKNCKFSELKTIRKSFQLIEMQYMCKKGNEHKRIGLKCGEWEKRIKVWAE